MKIGRFGDVLSCYIDIVKDWGSESLASNLLSNSKNGDLAWVVVFALEKTKQRR